MVETEIKMEMEMGADMETEMEKEMQTLSSVTTLTWSAVVARILFPFPVKGVSPVSYYQ